MSVQYFQEMKPSKMSPDELLKWAETLTVEQKAALLRKLKTSPKKPTCKFTYTTVKATLFSTCRFCDTKKTEHYNVEVLASEAPRSVEHNVKTLWCSECENVMLMEDKRVVLHKAVELLKSLSLMSAKE